MESERTTSSWNKANYHLLMALIGPWDGYKLIDLIRQSGSYWSDSWECWGREGEPAELSTKRPPSWAWRVRVSLPNSRQRPPSDEQLSFGAPTPKERNLKNHRERYFIGPLDWELIGTRDVCEEMCMIDTWDGYDRDVRRNQVRKKMSLLYGSYWEL